MQKEEVAEFLSSDEFRRTSVPTNLSPATANLRFDPKNSVRICEKNE